MLINFSLCCTVSMQVRKVLLFLLLVLILISAKAQEFYAVEWFVADEIMPAHVMLNADRANGRLPIGYTPSGNVYLIPQVDDGTIDTANFFMEFLPDGTISQAYLLSITTDSFLLNGLPDTTAFIHSLSPGLTVVNQKQGHYVGRIQFKRVNSSGIYWDSHFGAVVFDIPGGSVWGKCVSTKYTGTLLLSLLDEERILMEYVFDTSPSPSHYGSSRDSLSLAMFNYNTDELLWSYSYQFADLEADSSYYGIDAGLLPNGDLSILGNEFIAVYRGVDPSGEMGAFFLLRLNEEGDVIRSVRYVGGSGGKLKPQRQVISPEGDIYLFGLVENDLSGGYSINEEDYFIARLNSDYEVQWVRRIYVESFQPFLQSFQLLANGELTFGITTTGFFPVIYGRVSATGELLNAVGYAIPSPQMSFDEFGSLAMPITLRIEGEGGGLIWTAGLIKTDSMGNLDSCFLLPPCISLEDNLSMELEEAEWVRHPGVSSFGNVSLSLDTMDASSSPYCDFPTLPSVDFVTPDTLCVGECLDVEGIQGGLANKVKWLLQGPGGLDTSLVFGPYDVSDFSWCFEKPGHYYLSREIWVLGCADLYEREIVVLDDKEPLFTTEIVACQQPPYSLSANASRPLTSYLWNNGSTAAELEVTSSGTYWLEASDGYCMLRDTVQLTFLGDLLDQGPALSLPTDTSVCEQHLPYILLPQSPYAEDFSVPAISNSSTSSFELWQAGSYEVQAELFGCPIKDTFALEVNDCLSRIYFPTAFSPNGDGLNDLFLPQGKDYRGIELQVYDRWGGLLFSSQSPPFVWDGSDAAGGLYVYRFRYFNTLALQEEEISGQVVLLR